MDFTYPPNLRFECSRCGLCCGDTKTKTRHVLLIETEAQDIAAQTRQQPGDFCVEVSGSQPYVYEMKKTAEGKCVFLKDNQCSIYPLRPLICRFYPFELKFNPQLDKHTFNHTLECPGVNQGAVMHEEDFLELFLLATKKLK